MHRLARRSVSALLRNGGASRYRYAAAPFSSSNPLHDSNGETDVSSRWYSVLISGNSNRPATTKPLNLRNGLHLGNRFESTAAASESDAPAETHEYQAEVSRLMDLIVNSLYSNKEVFLRELISNASDALDKLRFLSVTDPDLLQGAVDLDIRIQTDKDNRIVNITDSGIGMTHSELVDCLGTIAQSGTAKFLKALKDSKDAGVDSNLIGQFGVGFYSAFLVADKVVVSTKSPKSDKQYVWEGETNSSTYTIREETDPEKILPRGTRLTLYLKRDEKGYAHPERIQKLVKNYSQFVSFPIYTWQEKGYTKEVEVDEDPAEAKKDETEANTEKKKKTKTVVEKYWDWELTNETQPIWLRNPKEVSTEEYNEFYKKAFNEYLGPLASSHFTTEVLFLVDPIDEIAITNLKSYKEKNFMDISKEDLDIGEKNEEKEKEMKQEFGPTFYRTRKMASVSSTTNLLLLRLSRPAFSPPSSVRFLTTSPSRPLYLREAPERCSHVHSPLSYYYPSRNFCSSSSPPLNLGEELSQGPAPMSHRFKTCRLLTSNVWNRELTVIQRRILRKLRSKNRAFKRRIYSKRNQNSFIQLQSTRKLSLCYGAAIRKGNLQAQSRASYLLDLERRLDVIQVRMNFSKTVHQARQLISHGKVRVNGKTVRIAHLKLSQGDIISLQDGASGERIRKLLYIESLVDKVIGKSQKNPLRIWRRTKTEWFHLLKTKRGCRRLLKSRFLQQLRSSMQEDDLERTKKFGSFAEHNKIKWNLYHLKSMFLSRVGKQNPALRSSLVDGSSLYSRSTYVSASPCRSTRRRKRMELPTHYLEVNHKISKGVVFY